MRTPRRLARFTLLASTALIGLSQTARADEPAALGEAATSLARREVVLALGYGSIFVPHGIDVTRVTNTAERTSSFTGISVDVTRRLPLFEVGARFWTTGGSSDARGSSAHVLTTFTTEARFYPWAFRTVEPWVGGELGLALADDYADWNKTDQEPAHHAAADVRPGFVAGLELGVRVRLSSYLALGAHGGPRFLGFDRAGGPVAESPQAAKFFVQPTDYGQRAWVSMALTAELTVPD